MGDIYKRGGRSRGVIMATMETGPGGVAAKPQATGFKVKGGSTTQKELTVDEDITVSDIVVNTDYSAKGVILVGTGAGTFTALTVGDDDQVLKADSGEASGVKWAAAGGGGSVLYSVAYAAGDSGNWTAPTGCYKVYITGGAGGGGGGMYNTYSADGGGGAGACANRYPLTVTPGSVYAYSVGRGSSGGDAISAGIGRAGGNTSFGALTLYGGSGGGANGGNGGAFGKIPGKLGAASGNPPFGSNSDTYDVAYCVGAGGGAGGSAIIATGGSSPLYSGGSAYSTTQGGGGASLFGAGGNANGSGAGGTGGTSAGGGSGTSAGGGGGDGFLLIEYWIAETP